MIFSLEKKAMITEIPLQDQLRTYKNEEKNNVRAFFQTVGLGPPPPTAKPDENFLDMRMDIRYRGGRETISLLVLPRSNYHVYICLFVNIEIKTVGWHIQQSGVVISYCIAQKVESLAAEHT